MSTCTGCSSGCSDCGSLQCGTGPAGLDGLNAFTTTIAAFTVPSVAANVTITVSTLSQLGPLWGAVGQPIFIEGAGSYRVVSTTASTMTVTNLGGSLNAVPTTVIALGADVSPSGEGISGTDGTTIIYQNTAEQNTGGNLTTSYYEVIGAGVIPVTGIDTIGDQVRIEATFIGDMDDEADGFYYYAQILFGGTAILSDIFLGASLDVSFQNAMKMTIDLIVTATNTMKAKEQYSKAGLGNRTNQSFADFPASIFYAVHDVDSTTIAPNLAISNDITIKLKKTAVAGSPSASVELGITDITVYKMLKS